MLGDLINGDRATVVELDQQLVLLPQRAFDLLPQDGLIEDVLHPDTQAPHLVHVGRTDAAASGADGTLTQETFGDLVHGLVIGGHQVGVGGDLQPRGVRAAGL